MSPDKPNAAAMSAACDIIENLPYSTDGGYGQRALIGLISLARDYTVEQEMGRVLAGLDDVAHYITRIDSPVEVRPETLAAMGPNIAAAAQLLLNPDDVDVVAYGCTSASAVLGPDAVSKAIRSVHPQAKVTNPLTATCEAVKALGIQRLGVLTPYASSVNQFIYDALSAAGIHIEVFGSFNIEHDPTVAKLDAKSVSSGIHRIVKGRALDGIFVSCTNVRLVDQINDLEQALNLPVLSSNAALIWHALRLGGVDDVTPELGTLARH